MIIVGPVETGYKQYLNWGVLRKSVVDKAVALRCVVYVERYSFTHLKLCLDAHCMAAVDSRPQVVRTTLHCLYTVFAQWLGIQLLPYLRHLFAY